MRNARRSEISEHVNLEQGVKRLTASESSKTRLSNRNSDQDKILTKECKLQTIKQRVQTAKRRSSRQVFKSLLSF
jgi:hypothetical protein